MGGDIVGCQVELDGPCSQGGNGIVPIRGLVGLTNGKSQIRGTETRNVEFVGQTAVDETLGSLVEFAELEDCRVACGQRPINVA